MERQKMMKIGHAKKGKLGVEFFADTLRFFLMEQEIAKDDILSRCKIIAEPWDCGGLYLVGRFPNWDR